MAAQLARRICVGNFPTKARNSTLLYYKCRVAVISALIVIFENKCRIWTRYGGAGDYVAPTWTEKDLYLGPAFNELINGNYTPVPIRFAGTSLEDLKYELGDRTSCYIAFGKSCHSWPCPSKCGHAKSQRTGGLCNVLYARNARNGRRCNYTTSCKSSSCNVCQLDNSVGINGKHDHG